MADELSNFDGIPNAGTALALQAVFMVTRKAHMLTHVKQCHGHLTPRSTPMVAIGRENKKRSYL
ncbi:hypothetical protein [Burkholderia sp. BCC0419]|uniref:hypothetical protein n=1 Tax=Burkholderia sp. BCC0419 TaxID=486878 RepID=UPI00158BE72A|nr:hypothetical protein [Burkholderia sp. BCC0419]